MDGEALMAAFATCSGPDCIKDVIATYGTRLKEFTMLQLENPISELEASIGVCYIFDATHIYKTEAVDS